MRWRTLLAGLTLSLSCLTAALVADDSWVFADWRSDHTFAEEFLSSGEIVGSEVVPVGISRPTKLTLVSDGVTAAAIFKTIDAYEPKMQFEDGSFALNFRDSYKSELAAYELDKMLGLGLVPPTVERGLDGKQGALRLWIEGAVTEAERQKLDLQAPDPGAWGRQVAAVRLFFNLTANADFNNIRNVLVDQGFEICAIDHSRAFQTRKKLVSEEMLTSFSRRLLAQLEALDQETLTERLGDWVSKSQIKALLKRRDMILSRADKLVALKGEAAVLFD